MLITSFLHRIVQRIMETWKKYFSIPFCLNAKIDFKNTTSRLELSLAYYNSVLKIYLFSNIPDNFAKARVYPLSCQSFEKTTQNSQQICKNGFHSFLNLFSSSTLNQTHAVILQSGRETWSDDHRDDLTWLIRVFYQILNQPAFPLQTSQQTLGVTPLWQFITSRH